MKNIIKPSDEWNSGVQGDYLNSLKTHWDIKYTSPEGGIGTLHAWAAYDEEHARIEAPHWLTANSPYSPNDVTILEVVPTPESKLPKI